MIYYLLYLLASTSARKRTSGVTRQLDLVRMPTGQKLLLQFKKFGQTIGTHATKFLGTVGTVRIEVPLSTLHWVNVTENHKETMYQRIVVNQFILKCNFTSNYFIYAYISICKDLIGLNSHCYEKYKFEETPKIKG